MNFTIIEDLGMKYRTKNSKQKTRFVRALCHCGDEFDVALNNLKTQKSCGCAKTKHNLTKHVLFSRWNSMMNRCYNKNQKSYINYGERGITVCEEWHKIENFIEDMYPTFKSKLSLDRIDVNKGYSKDNCRWATGSTQARNTRTLTKANSSGYRGVGYKKDRNKWEARITVDRKTITIGRFKTALEAAKAFDNYVDTHKLDHSKNFN